LKVGLTERANSVDSSEYRLPNSRLLNPPDEMLDLASSVQEEILRLTEENRQRVGKPPSKSRITPDNKITREKRNPRNGLLLLYPLDPEYEKAKLSSITTPIIGFCISFPNSNSAKAVEYRVNNPYWEQDSLDSYED
jgi:hypothetical protein